MKQPATKLVRTRRTWWHCRTTRIGSSFFLNNHS